MTRQYSEESAAMHMSIGDPNHEEFARHLDTVGDGSGTKNMAAVAATYRLTPPSGTIFVVDEIRIVGWDNAVPAGGGFIGIAALVTGCKLEIREKPHGATETVVEDLTGGVPIQNNGHLCLLGTTTFMIESVGIQCIVQCSIKNKSPYRINGSRGESLVFQTQDNLAGLVGLYVSALGREYVNDAI